MKKFPSNPVIGIVPLAISPSLLAGCSRGTPAKKVAAMPVLVAQAATTNVPVQIDPPPFGHVTPYSTVTIRPQIGGIFVVIHFQVEQEMAKSDLLFSIEPTAS